MKKKIIFLLLILVVFILSGIYFFNKRPFVSPIQYDKDLVIRSDGRGSGYFASERNGRRLHAGLDLQAEVGSAVLASRTGRVIVADQNRGMGKYIIIRHDKDVVTIYGHLLGIYVRKNQRVRQGQIIGCVGKTGNANFRDIQPHLHFEIRKRGVPQDPMEYVKKN